MGARVLGLLRGLNEMPWGVCSALRLARGSPHVRSSDSSDQLGLKPRSMCLPGPVVVPWSFQLPTLLCHPPLSQHTCHFLSLGLGPSETEDMRARTEIQITATPFYR